VPRPDVDPTAAAVLPRLSAATATGAYQKDVRRTVLGSSIAKTTQRGGQKEKGTTATSILSAGTALSTAKGRSSKLGPALSPVLSAAAAHASAVAAGSSSSSAAAANATATAAASNSVGYTDELLEGDDGDEDQLLYEGGGGDDGDYDDYDDEYY
jgi:hypothetical protein